MSFILLEYRCPECGASIESLETRAAPAATVPHCGASAARIISAVSGRLKRGEVTTGKNGDPPPGVIDTRPLADGMSVHEFRAKHRAKRVKERYSALKANAG